MYILRRFNSICGWWLNSQKQLVYKIFKTLNTQKDLRISSKSGLCKMFEV